MANRRMFSKDITNSEEFLDMPDSTQKLYFHLGMNADDDGFIQPKGIMRLVRSGDDDLKILQAKGFVIILNGNVIVITQWKTNNEIRIDRYKPTIYQEHLKSLQIGENKAYLLKNDLVLPTVTQMETQVRLGKDRLGEVTSEKQVFAEEEKVEARNPTFEEFMVDLGFEPYEFLTDEGAHMTYKTDTGSILSVGKIKTYENQYTRKYGRKEGLEELAKILKPMSEKDQVIQIFSFNEASRKWFNNKTQITAINDLLEDYSVHELSQIVSAARELKKRDPYAPEITTPYELFNKMIKLKDRAERGFEEKVGVV